MIYKATIKKEIKIFLLVFELIYTGFSLQAQERLDKNFKKLADKYDLEYQIPKNYLGIAADDHYQPWADFHQMPLRHSIKYRKHGIVIAFTMISTKPDTPKMIRMREVMGGLDKISLVALTIEADTTLSKVKYLDTLQLKKVNANRGVIFNMRMNNKYIGTYARCKKVEIYKDNVGRAEILFFYNKGDDALVDEEIKKTWGMLKFK